MRNASRQAGGWVLVILAVSLAGLAAVLKVPVGVTGAVVAAVAVANGVLAAVGTKRIEQRADGVRTRRELLRAGRRGRLPLVRHLDDPVTFGVHPAAPASDGKRSPPAYVRRDVDERVEHALTCDRYVLLVGESTAGKSRLALEVVRRVLPRCRLVQPTSPAGARVAVDTVVAASGSVLWLDDLERFLGQGGLTGQDVQRMLEAPGRPRHIVATMRSEEYRKFFSAASDVVAADTARQGRDVLRLATRVDVNRLWSQEELARARDHVADARMATAVAQAGRFGVAEFLAAGPQLLSQWHDAWAPGANPRGAALVLAAVDARRAGVHRGVPAAVLVAMHEAYLDRRGGLLLRPESLDNAFAWAGAPLHATSSLLLPEAGGECHLAFDYLIDAVPKDPIPGAALRALLCVASPQEAVALGEAAQSWQKQAIARQAYHMALDAGEISALAPAVYLLEELEGKAAAAELSRTVMRRVARGSADWFEARRIIAWQRGENGDAAGACAALDRLAGQARHALGAGHKTTVRIMTDTVWWIFYRGDAAAAVSRGTALAEEFSLALGEDDERTIRVQEAVATMTADHDPPAGAEAATALLDRVFALRGTTDPVSLQLRQQCAWLLKKAGRHGEALTLWSQSVEAFAAMDGPLHIRTLSARCGRADALGHLGRHADAVREYQEVMDHLAGLADPGLFTMDQVVTARGLASWTGCAGDPEAAVAMLEELAGKTASSLGESDVYRLGILARLAHWIGEAGAPEEAVRRLASIAETPCLDPFLARRIRDGRAYWRDRVAGLDVSSESPLRWP
ncbi:tetratricopeptide repeat protein [Nonomuraea gerenzanensis]|uniref:Putative ATP /GTP-binding protein n=1 Tax=Nonomuraea gerenzanensis TaxID=93944 RepID=A0A1M4EMZ1_9ACTN|nr:tetratricopeptide repeat protein [Nonomuraea gerenzanensis]UBU11686.1 tetratricopeptide repeat protein [Nonomuraea gerenzanensis]SBP00184.1 putative ATP /GTP-binding protein [Nonomuraea gerenzanensis]